MLIRVQILNHFTFLIAAMPLLAFGQSTDNTAFATRMRNLEVGNAWVYSVDTTGVYSTVEGPIQLYEITHSELREGREFRFLRSRSFELSGVQTKESICSFEFNPNSSIESTPARTIESCDTIETKCFCTNAPMIYGFNPNSGGTSWNHNVAIQVGAQQFEVSATARTYLSGGGGWGGGFSQQRRATDIGVYSFSSGSSDIVSSRSLVATLTFARI